MLAASCVAYPTILQWPVNSVIREPNHFGPNRISKNSKSNQISNRKGSNQIFWAWIESPICLKLWFKSNHDLILPTAETYTQTGTTENNTTHAARLVKTWNWNWFDRVVMIYCCICVVYRQRICVGVYWAVWATFGIGSRGRNLYVVGCPRWTRCADVPAACWWNTNGPLLNELVLPADRVVRPHGRPYRLAWYVCFTKINLFHSLVTLCALRSLRSKEEYMTSVTDRPTGGFLVPSDRMTLFSVWPYPRWRLGLLHVLPAYMLHHYWPYIN